MTDCTDRTGELIFGRPAPPRQLPFALMPVEKAACAALSAYLQRQTFLVHEGKPAVDELSRTKPLQLVRILDDFPAAHVQLAYPSASLVAVGAVEHEGGFQPSVREDTYDPDRGTVVWNIGECTGLLQLDIWADSVAAADAFYARLPALMNPGDGVGGLHLRLPPGYLSAPCRYLLVQRERRDTVESAYANERRVSATIRFDAPDLDLRCATVLDPRVSTEVGP